MCNLSASLFFIIKFTIFGYSHVMKNKFFALNLEQLKCLSKLGLCVKQAGRCKTSINKSLDICDIIEEVERQRLNIYTNEDHTIDDFIDCKILKPLTIFRNVYPYHSNMRTSIATLVLKNEDNKSVILERLDLILFHLNLLNNSK